MQALCWSLNPPAGHTASDEVARIKDAVIGTDRLHGQQAYLQVQQFGGKHVQELREVNLA